MSQAGLKIRNRHLPIARGAIALRRPLKAGGRKV
jgi:hypothetical protein